MYIHSQSFPAYIHPCSFCACYLQIAISPHALPPAHTRAPPASSKPIFSLILKGNHFPPRNERMICRLFLSPVPVMQAQPSPRYVETILVHRQCETVRQCHFLFIFLIHKSNCVQVGAPCASSSRYVIGVGAYVNSRSVVSFGVGSGVMCKTMP